MHENQGFGISNQNQSSAVKLPYARWSLDGGLSVKCCDIRGDSDARSTPTTLECRGRGGFAKRTVPS